MAWQNPKTDWVTGNGLAAADVNRIEENTRVLKETSDKIINGGQKVSDTDTVDGSHAWQMQTLNEAGQSHGMSHQLLCKFNVDKDNFFKLVTSENLPVKVDKANSWGGCGLFIGTHAQAQSQLGSTAPAGFICFFTD